MVGGPRASAVVYAAGAVQGIVLVTAPAASTVFTSPTGYDLSSARYGTLFLPQVVTAVAGALLGPRLLRLKTALVGGLACGLLAMALLVASQILIASPGTAYTLLLIATAGVGAGFGLAVPALNSLAAVFHPRGPDRAVLVLNALLGLGTALAPAFVVLFVGLGFWWGLPILSGVLLLGLLGLAAPLALAGPPRPTGRAGPLPRRLWLYAGFAVLYGACETVNGNWAQLDLTTAVGASAAVAAAALTAFWAMVTVGRIGFAALDRVIPPRWTLRLLPIALAGVFLLVAALPSGRGGFGIVAFGLAGLACSALLPLIVSFGQAEFAAIAATVSGVVIAAYQLGFGIAAFGVGPLHSAGVGLPTTFAFAAIGALGLAGLAIPVTRRRGSDSPHRTEPAGRPAAGTGTSGR